MSPGSSASTAIHPAFAGIVGQDRALTLLEAALRQPRHAYLLVGPPNVGKTMAATAWCRALFCRDHTGCGTCPECRTFDHGNYADFHLWQPATKSTTIEQVREIVRQSELAPYRGDYQVHIVLADTMSTAAANCLLKTLEEPPGGTILLLLAQSVSDVLPTIVSRCQRIPFNLVRQELVAGWLRDRQGATPEQAAIAARRSAGRIGYALSLLTQEASSPRLLTALDPLAALEEAERAANLPPDQQLGLLEDLTLMVRDTMVLIQTGREDWVGQPDVARQLQATGRTHQAWGRILVLLDDTRHRIAAGAGAKLAWTVTANHITRILA